MTTSTLQMDACSSCRCSGGSMGCSGRGCGVSCSNPVYIEGRCCPVCPENSCEHADGFILVGENYKVDNCMTCTCPAAGAEPACFTPGCYLPPECDSPAQIAGQCCPVCEAPVGCPYNGMVIPLNNSFKPDACTKCTCYEADEPPVCLPVFCPSLACPNKINIAGECCPICPNM
ncbi:PREDICTED: cysteine-rich motor neuron 1 protein-like [Branchiostoma belcheri]|uniref:Cysteine-rich motor neuron 1 protein-like n=1 Tax=Branchiostoma belcheri TaxID=7741 RepID=A0A6P5ACJ0_BRABE|nr:PREDICTED: cysteine-rich motor neuron 1 protein-like [Branchiostoma belcheri]